MKHECPTYLKSIGKSKALAAILSDTEPEEDFDNEDDGILNAFITTVSLALFNMFLFVFFSVLVYFVFNIKIKKN